MWGSYQLIKSFVYWLTLNNIVTVKNIVWNAKKQNNECNRCCAFYKSYMMSSQKRPKSLPPTSPYPWQNWHKSCHKGYITPTIDFAWHHITLINFMTMFFFNFKTNKLQNKININWICVKRVKTSFFFALITKKHGGTPALS